MSKTLPDREIRRLFGNLILNADEKRLNPNGIEIRLGKHVLFQSTGEEKELSYGMYLNVRPGESVQITSYEEFVFTPEAIGKIFPGRGLMALITPTTTMMREGILQSATKIDFGFAGVLNWGLRNSSMKNFVIGFCEPIFKLTIYLLDQDEIPEIPYGGRDSDAYQGSHGIARSARKVPVQIPKAKLVESSVEKLDPARQLREAGYPFDHISTELTILHGKFEVVSKDMLLMKDQFETRTGELGRKIEEESKSLSRKIDETKTIALQQVDALFDRKFLSIAGSVIGCLTIIFGAITFLRSHGITGDALGLVALLGGLGILLVVFLLARRKA